MARKRARAPRRTSASQPLRFAHPFFTTTPISQRPVHPKFGQRLTDYIKGNLETIPAPKRPPLMTLSDIIGATATQEIQNTSSVSFHAVGDTGRSADSPQGYVAEAMAKDFKDVSKPAECPAFFFHLGDVIYGHDKVQSYRREFYEPYVHYPGKIIAIPGNHDGETFPGSDPTTLQAFQANFCAPSQSVPTIAGTIFRQTMNQPAVYWQLNAPFVDIVGLYSNAAENPGFISGQIPGQAQKTWLIGCLRKIKAQRNAGVCKALVFASHHPPYSVGGHSGSSDMLADIDDACNQAGIMPDLYLSGHSHSYQRYSRQLNFGGRSLNIPYIVAGTGGINDQTVPQATGQVTSDSNGQHTYLQSYRGYGYLLVQATKQGLTVNFNAVDEQTRQIASGVDHVTINVCQK